MRTRTKRPQPLHLSSAPVVPQEVQSAALPARRGRQLDMAGEDIKRQWRRTTIAASYNTSSKIILLSSPGKIAEIEYASDMPPVPPLSPSFSATSPTTTSPLTPMPFEDQIRRELETFALKEGPNSVVSRRSSVISRRRTPAAFVPNEDDKMVPRIPNSPSSERPTGLIDVNDDDGLDSGNRPTIGRTKSFFRRFEKKNDVDALLDLYMTDEQLIEDKQIKRKATKSTRQTFFRRWQSSGTSLHKSEIPK